RARTRPLFVRPTRSVRLDDAGNRANRDDEPDREDECGAHGREGAHEWAVERKPSKRASRDHGDQTDRGDRRGEAEAERDDQGESQTDAMQRDRRQEDDERRRTWEEPGCDSDAENALGRERRVLVMVVMVVTVMVVVAMTVLVRVFFVAGAPRAKPLPQDGGADEHHQQAR